MLPGDGGPGGGEQGGERGAAADALDRPGLVPVVPSASAGLPPELDGVAAEVRRIRVLATG
ncbi:MULTISPECIES: hypothetical protein [Kitasatospora]|uniref:hypothetical protein n=1 Tax=Kitasatospora TaxID=2063 RepID=UPI0011D1A844|nr:MULTISPECIES: hypothetical protein [Kitasatospora]